MPPFFATQRVLQQRMICSALLALALATPGSSQIVTTPAIDHLGTASGFGGFPGVAAPGSWVELYGSNLAGTTREWTGGDFKGTSAPTSLDGVTVTVGGKSAYISYISPTQVNIQIPDGIPTGGAASVIASYQGQSSSATPITINAQQPGLLAPASFNVGGKQYVVAVHSGTGAIVGNGTIFGVPAAPAVAGETLTFYGTGFGTVTQGNVAGEIARGQTALTNAFALTVGGSTAAVSYAGLAPGLVGVYQFNVAVPASLPSGDLPVRISLNGSAISLQTLLLPVAATGSTGATPGAPTNVSATAGNTTAILTFTAPASNGSAAITQYRATCTSGSTSKIATGTSSPIFIAGLTNDATFTCVVAATNSAGTGNASVSASVTPSIGSSSTLSTLWIPDTMTGTKFDLTLAPNARQLRSGTPTKTYSYNEAGFWGPTLIMNKGDMVQMNVTNKLPDTTTTHWHGFHIPAVTDGGPHQPIAVGETWSPTFEIKNSAATFWYHPHLHEKTVEHITYGAGGFIIVKDPVEAALPLPRTYGIDDIPLVFTSRRFLAGSNQFDTSAAISPYGDFELTNGTLNAQMSLPAQFVRLRILNAEIERAYNVGFSDNRTFYVIGNDGGLLDAPVPVTRLKVYVGERYEVLVDLTKDAPGTQLDINAYNSGQILGFPGSEPQTSGTFGSLLNNTTFRLLHVNVASPNGNGIASLPTTLVKNTYWTSSDASKSRTVLITDQGPGTPFTFDNLGFNMDRINQTVSLNGIEAWTISNGRTFSHAFHIHDVQFKIISRSSGAVGVYEQGWKDTVAVPRGESVTFIAKFDDFADVINPYMYHCHFSNHEDEGMMGQFIVIKP